MENLRKNVRFLRKLHNYSLEEFAMILGISRSFLSQFESGFSGFKLETIIKVSKIFKISLDDLILKDLTKQR